MARKPLGDKPMTQAERQSRKRDRDRQTLEELKAENEWLKAEIERLISADHQPSRCGLAEGCRDCS